MVSLDVRVKKILIKLLKLCRRKFNFKKLVVFSAHRNFGGGFSPN